MTVNYDLIYRQLRTQQRIKLHVHLFLSLLVRGIIELCWDVQIRYKRLEQDPQSRDEVTTAPAPALIIFSVKVTLYNSYRVTFAPCIYRPFTNGKFLPCLKFAQTRPCFVQEIRQVLTPSTDDGGGGGVPKRSKKKTGLEIRLYDA